MKEKYSEWFRQARDTWSDEIPEQMLDGSLPDEEKKYKCRKNWFYGVRNMIDLLIELREMPEIPEVVQQYRDYVGSQEFGYKERTTFEDITFGNEVISYLLDHC